MDIFISWSGERGGKVATALQHWIPRVIQAVDPWLSSGSIDPGARWNDEVVTALERMQYGILCLTPESINSPWILFEAGALSKAVSKSRVVPYLVGFEPRELQGPLAQFQAVRADEDGTLRLLKAINIAKENALIAADVLDEAFALWWPRLERKLSEIIRANPQDPPPPKRSLEDMVGEALELLRSERFNNRLALDSAFQNKSDSSLGDRIRRLRISRHFSQEMLADLLGVSQAYISKLENGLANPSATTLWPLAKALGVSANELLGNEPSRQLSDATRVVAAQLGSDKFIQSSESQVIAKLLLEDNVTEAIERLIGSGHDPQTAKLIAENAWRAIVQDELTRKDHGE